MMGRRRIAAGLLAGALGVTAAGAQIAGRSTGWCTDHSGRNFRCGSGGGSGGVPGLSPAQEAGATALGGLFGGMIQGFMGMLEGSAHTQRVRRQIAMLKEAGGIADRALAAYEAGRVEEALELFRQASGVVPLFSPPLAARALYLAEARGPSWEAVALLEQAIHLEEQGPGNGWVFPNPKYLPALRGKLEEWRAALAAAPRHGSYGHEAPAAPPARGPGSYAHGAAAPAGQAGHGATPIVGPAAARQDELLEAMLAKDPRDAGTLELYVRAAEARGDRVEALARARLYLGRAPDDPVARELVARLDPALGGAAEGMTAGVAAFSSGIAPPPEAPPPPTPDRLAAFRARLQGAGPAATKARVEAETRPEATDFRVERWREIRLSRGSLLSTVHVWYVTRLYARAEAPPGERLKFGSRLQVLRPGPEGFEEIGEAMVIKASNRGTPHLEADLTRLSIGECTDYSAEHIGGTWTAARCDLNQVALKDHTDWVLRVP